MTDYLLQYIDQKITADRRKELLRRWITCGAPGRVSGPQTNSLFLALSPRQLPTQEQLWTLGSRKCGKMTSIMEPLSTTTDCHPRGATISGCTNRSFYKNRPCGIISFMKPDFNLPQGLSWRGSPSTDLENFNVQSRVETIQTLLPGNLFRFFCTPDTVYSPIGFTYGLLLRLPVNDLSSEVESLRHSVYHYVHSPPRFQLYSILVIKGVTLFL